MSNRQRNFRLRIFPPVQFFQYLLLRTGLMVADIYRESGKHHRVLPDALDAEDFREQSDPAQALTQAYTTIFEGHVLANPDPWFWIHDRWKSAEKAAARSSVTVASGIS